MRTIFMRVGRLLLIVAFMCVRNVGVSQQISIDTDEIESLIDEWNFANNTRNLHSFERVYSEELTFYTETVSRRRAIALKEQLFKQKPYFRQRIITEITYKPYSKGIVKADFTKEVFEKTYWKKYPSYLLVSYDNRQYSIVGESDYATDRVLKYKPDLGEPITFEKTPEPSDTLADDTAHIETPITSPVRAETASDAVAARDTTLHESPAFNLANLQRVFYDASSLGVVAVPRGYLFILIGLLALGGLMIFIADSVASRRRTPQHVSTAHDEAEHIVRDFKMQSGFEAFVTTLFDPLFFKIRRLKTEHVYAGQGAPAEKGPDFLLDYKQKDTHVRFAIKCQYYKNVAKNEVQLFTDERHRMIRQFGEERDMEVYYVLGFGGTPDDPKELFMIPAKDVTSEFISKSELRNYSKSGMFYYSRATGRIQ